MLLFFLFNCKLHSMFVPNGHRKILLSQRNKISASMVAVKLANLPNVSDTRTRLCVNLNKTSITTEPFDLVSAQKRILHECTIFIGQKTNQERSIRQNMLQFNILVNAMHEVLSSSLVMLN